MKTLFCIFITLLVLVSGLLCPTFPEPLPLSASNPVVIEALNKLDAFLRKIVSQNNLPGFVVSVVYDDQLFWSMGYGRNNPFNSSDTSAPTLDSVVSVASITKVFTDIMLLKLRDEGIVTLESPLVNYFPGFSVINPYKTQRPITLHQLGSHTSGLQREVPCTEEEVENNTCTEDKVFERLANRILVLPQNTRGHYSNLGFAILGRALEKASSTIYEEFLQTQVFDKLGMTSSGFDINKLKPHLAIGTDFLPDGTPVPAEILDLGWSNPMGGLFSTARDIAKFMSFMFSTDKPGDGKTQILDGNTITEMLEPVISFDDGVGGFGLPWETSYTSNMTLKSKAGQLPGYRSQVVIVPKIKLGIFHCATVASVSDSTVWTLPALDILIPAFLQALNKIQPNPPLPPNWKTYTGIYGTIEMMLEVYVENNNMYLASLDNTTRVNPLLLTAQDGFDTVMRIHASPDICRWLDDGTNLEFVYFSWNSDKSQVVELLLMENPYRFIGKH